MMYPDPTYIPRPLPPEGSICVVKYGRRAGSRVTVLHPLRTGEDIPPVQVLVQFDTGETWAKFPWELSSERDP